MFVPIIVYIIIVQSVWVGIQSQKDDLCTVIAPNGIYKPIKLYQQRYLKTGTHGIGGQLMMYTTDKEWEFWVIHTNDSIDISEQFDPKSPTIVTTWSMGSHRVLPNGTSFTTLVTCYLDTKHVTQYQCYEAPNGKLASTGFLGPTDFVFKSDPNANMAFAVMATHEALPVFQIITYGSDWKVLTSSQRSQYVLQYTTAGEQLIGNISVNMYTKLNGITDYSDGHMSGHVLVFNIAGRPMYCVVPKGKSPKQLCDQQKLKPMADQCFGNTTLGTTTSSTTGSVTTVTSMPTTVPTLTSTSTSTQTVPTSHSMPGQTLTTQSSGSISNDTITPSNGLPVSSTMPSTPTMTTSVTTTRSIGNQQTPKPTNLTILYILVIGIAIMSFAALIISMISLYKARQQSDQRHEPPAKELKSQSIEEIKPERDVPSDLSVRSEEI